MTPTTAFQPARDPFTVDDPYPTGDCPVCGGINIPLIGRRKLAPHGQHVRHGREVVESDTPCDGSCGPTAEDLVIRTRRQPRADRPASSL